MFEECCAQNSSSVHRCRSEFQTLIVVQRCAKHKCLLAVFGIVAVLVWFVVDECLHAKWDERMPVVVMVAIYVCIG